MEDPPGGPPDFTAPILVAIVPDTGAVLADRDARVRFTFNEVIQERGLDALVTVSPRHEEIDVEWSRSAVSVRPEGGWRDSVAYVVTLAAGVIDLRGNQVREDARVVFTTGGPLAQTLLTGIVVDWEAGRRAAGALVEAIRGDSLTYLTSTDSAGGFALPHLPPGSWSLIATIEARPNQRRERREPFDSLAVTVASGDTTRAVLWTVTHDTAGPSLRGVQRHDSLTMRLTFVTPLAPEPPTTAAVGVWLLPDSMPAAVDSVFSERAWRARADTAPAADTIAVIDTTAVADTAATADTLLASRPALSSVWYVVLAERMAPGARYLVLARAANAAGYAGSTRGVLVVPDTSQAVRP